MDSIDLEIFSGQFKEKMSPFCLQLGNRNPCWLKIPSPSKIPLCGGGLGIADWSLYGIHIAERKLRQQIYPTWMLFCNRSRVQRLQSYHYTSFCKRFVRENGLLTHPHKSGTWYLAIIRQNQHFLRGLRVFNFVLAPNPERWTLNLWTLTYFVTTGSKGLSLTTSWKTSGRA